MDDGAPDLIKNMQEKFQSVVDFSNQAFKILQNQPQV
jgi:hypothetical protein